MIYTIADWITEYLLHEHGAVLNQGELNRGQLAVTVDCLRCGLAIDYREGTCPHCGYVEFR